jgi:hypothetical protein
MPDVGDNLSRARKQRASLRHIIAARDQIAMAKIQKLAQ